MTRKKKTNRSRPGARQPPRGQVPRERSAPESPASADQLEGLFESLRSGAANVAGVSYQLGLTAWILVAGGGGAVRGLDVASVMPEGYEDIDCALRSGGRLLVQAKDRGPGARAIAMAEVAQIITHAARALGNEGRLAITTNGKFGSSLPHTGFSVGLADVLVAAGADDVRRALVESLRRQLDSAHLTDSTAEALVARTHLVATEWDLAHETLGALQSVLAIHPALASLVRAELLRDLVQVAAQQRESTSSTAVHRTFSDVELLTTRIQQDVDLPSLEEAVAAGVCEAADYVSPPSVDRAEFFAGVDVVPSHITAGFDVIRPEETGAVLEGLMKRGDVVIAGPSGSGKSALLWRAARLVEIGARVVRVLRVADDSDVELLVRHVRRMKPESTMRVLVVADDLGYDSMSSWPLARRRLTEIAGVLLLSAVRREHLIPARIGSAAVVDPVLTVSSAEWIHDALGEQGVKTVTAREEAVARADGLLMEFIAIATTGRRLREVLASQVASLSGPEHLLPRDALRLVCAVHLLGFAVAADALPPALDSDPGTVGDAMARLAGEHLVVSEGNFWHGLHDLRVEVLFELLHVTPPPSTGATYARALAALPVAVRGRAARRAAARVCRALTDATVDFGPSDRLGSLGSALEPVAAALRDDVRNAVDVDGDERATHVASLLEAADRLDTVAYAYAVLPFLESRRPSGLALRTMAETAYSARVDGLDLSGITEFAWFVALAAELPERSSRCASLVATGLTQAGVAETAMRLTLDGAVSFLESVESLATLTPALAREVYEHHATDVGTAAEPEIAGELRAQLTASLAVLAQLRGPDVAAALTAVEDRAAAAVACDPCGASIELSLEAVSPPDPFVANSVRGWTYSDEQMLVARAVAFARPSEMPPAPSAYARLPGADPGSLNEQAVSLARRVANACPEVDRVDVEIWQANCAPTSPTREDVKSLRAGVLGRRAETARNVAFQATVAEAVQAESWTQRLREQADIAQQLILLLSELPDRLRSYDNTARRRDWLQRAEAVSAAVARMPGPPPEHRRVTSQVSLPDGSRSAAELDEELRVKDVAKNAFDTLAGGLVQVGGGLGDDEAVRLAGGRFAEAPAQLRLARTDGAPVFVGLDTLPVELDDLSDLAGRLLTALDVSSVRRLRTGPRVGRETIDDILITAAEEASREDGERAASLLAGVGIGVNLFLALDGSPTPAWRTRRAVVVVDATEWESAAVALSEWDAPARERAGLSGRVIAVAVERGEILPAGLALFGEAEWILPLREDDFELLAEQLGMPLRASVVRSAIQACANRLAEYSYERVRQAHRTPSWWRPPTIATPPSDVRRALLERFGAELRALDSSHAMADGDRRAAEAATEVLALCDAVQAESGLPDGLAAQLAAIDVTDLANAAPGPLALRYMQAIGLAVEADAAPA